MYPSIGPREYRLGHMFESRCGGLPGLLSRELRFRILTDSFTHVPFWDFLMGL